MLYSDEENKSHQDLLSSFIHLVQMVMKRERERESEGLKFSRFIELAGLLGPKGFTYGRIGPHYNFIIMTSRHWPLV